MLGADLSFARGHCGEIVNTMWVLGADFSFARGHCGGMFLGLFQGGSEVTRNFREVLRSPGMLLGLFQGSSEVTRNVFRAFSRRF